MRKANDGSFTDLGHRIQDHVDNLKHENKHLKQSIEWLAATVVLQITLIVMLILYFTV